MKGFTRPRALDAFAQVCALAEGQSGYVAVAQLRDRVPEQFFAQWAEAKLVEPVIDGVIRVRAGGIHPYPRLYATWLLTDLASAGKRSLTALAVSHRSAAQLYGAGSISSSGFEFTGRTQRPLPADVTVHPGSLSDDDCGVVEGLPVTSPGRTLADLADGQGLDLSDLGRVARSFISDGLTTADQLGEELTDRFAGRDGGRDGKVWLQAALDAAAVG
jgi:hypothetical protein